MKSLTVEVPAVDAGSYDIKIGTGILSDVWGRLDEVVGKRSRIVVTDSNVANAGWADRLINGAAAEIYVIDPPGESSKHMNTIVGILEQMEKAAMGRDSVIVAIGGGTVGDMAGFAAAVFKRGVPVVHIPTTTVSQADSSIGGKTGVDSSMSKNAFGAFWHPSAVFIDVQTLSSLDQREYNAGLAESVKHALIASSEYFDFLENNIDKIIKRDSGSLEELAGWNCKIKAKVVGADPTEKNQRRILNYGHTIGHAVESASDFSLLHGECVGIGMIGAGIIEQEMGISQPGRLERVRSLLEKLEIPLSIPKDIDIETLVELLRRDKKAVGSWPRFALIKEVGKPFISDDGQWAHEVDKDPVMKAIKKLY